MEILMTPSRIEPEFCNNATIKRGGYTAGYDNPKNVSALL